jgi:hypothetical protein
VFAKAKIKAVTKILTHNAVKSGEELLSVNSGLNRKSIVGEQFLGTGLE